mgnify:CR=1 FL=1
MENKISRKSEALTAIILSFVGGILDVYCLFNFNVYATLHTGNIIKLVTNLVDGNISMFLATLFILIAFSVGIFFVNWFEKRHEKTGMKASLVMSIILLVLAMCVPNDTAPGILSNLKFLAATIFGFEGAFILHSFVKFGDYSYSATTMTANINRLVTNVYNRVSTKDKKYNLGIFVYLLIFAFFMLGVGVGYCFLKFLPTFETGFMSLYGYNLILIVPALCLLSILIMTIYSQKEQKYEQK